MSTMTTLSELCSASEYADWVCRRWPEWQEEIPRLELDHSLDQEAEMLQQNLQQCADDQAAMRALRQFRHRFLLAVLWQDRGAEASIHRILQWQSHIARVLIAAAYRYSFDQQKSRFGQISSPQGSAVHLVVMGMGKLGGGELNFSSDIDLVFAYDGSGESDGERALPAQRYFDRLGQHLIALLQQHTEDGFCYRVDMRLRPFGSAGNLTFSFDAMETYYQVEGRNWERYAWVKARAVGGDLAAGARLQKALRPFVYRRYLDFGALDGLREMHSRVWQDAKRRAQDRDLKLGPGGIRMLEFWLQTLQIIHGGRQPALQQESFYAALEAVEQAELITADQTKRISGHYAALRLLENRVQGIADQQTHLLPVKAEQLAKIGFTPDDARLGQLAEDGFWVEQQFNQLFASPEQSEFVVQWPPTPDLQTQLQHLNVPQTEEAALKLERFSASSAVRHASAVGRKRLGRFLPALVEQWVEQGGRVSTLSRLLRVTESVTRRTAYLSLLNENPGALAALVKLCDYSGWMADILVSAPVLFDELLDGRIMLAESKSREQHRAAVRAELGAAIDPEAQLNGLRHYRRASQLKLAARYLWGQADALQTAKGLSDLAAALVQVSGELVQQQMLEQYGALQHPSGEHVQLGVIAYGALGAEEMNFNSDLDMVFVHPSGVANLMSEGERSLDGARYLMRWSQRWVNALSTLTDAGRVYEVDNRLRPNGNAGMLVSSFEGFRQYQEERAWTWEHQAMLRSRILCGSDALAQAFSQLRESLLRRHRQPEMLAKEVSDMRQKMARFHHGAVADVKHGKGGLTELQFILQFVVLVDSKGWQDREVPYNTARLLERITHESSVLSSSSITSLREAYGSLMDALIGGTLKSNAVQASRHSQSMQKIHDTWCALMRAHQVEGIS